MGETLVKERLSKKQLEFLQALAESPRYGYKDKLPCICIGNMPEDIWFTFMTERQAYAWVYNLADRGFVSIEQEVYARITEKGIAAVKDRSN